MGGRGQRQTLEIVAALENRDDAPARVLLGQVHQLQRDPGEIALDELQLAQRVSTMRVEACRDDR